jgi:hypothetical protein
LIGCLRRTPDTYHLAGIKRGTATSNFHAYRDNLNTWIHDRFCQTYLDSWRTDSLFREWAYVNCETVAPCSPAQMATRRIDANLLAREIARRATSDRLGGGHGFVIPSKYVERALALIGRGETAAAAAIFDVVCEASPRSGEAFNNRGFCRLPDNATAALQDFEKAASLGMGGTPTTVGNRMLALFRLGRFATALEVAETWWSNTRVATGKSFMWDFDDSLNRIIEVDGLEYVAELASVIAETSGDSLSHSRWRSRLDNRHGDPA